MNTYYNEYENIKEPMEIEEPQLISTPNNKILGQQLEIHSFKNKFLTSNKTLNHDFAALTTEQPKRLLNSTIPSRLNLSNQPLISERKLNGYHTKLKYPYTSDNYNQALLSQVSNSEIGSRIPLYFQIKPTTGINSDTFRRKVSVILMNQMMMQRDLSKRCVNSMQLFSILPPAKLDDIQNERYEQNVNDIPETDPQTLKSKRVSWNSNIQIWKYCDNYPNRTIIPLPDEKGL